MTATLDAIARDAGWLAHRYDPGQDAIHFVEVPRAVHRQATFLTDDYLNLEQGPTVLARKAVIAQTPSPASMHFIFHSAFCCSTLLARAFDLPGVAMGLKEPAILNDIVGWRHRSAPPGAQVAEVLDHALRLLARPFEPGEATVLKPSNVAAGLYDVMLALRPDARAVLLHAPLPIYLRSIVKKGVDGRLWVRDLLAKLLRERLIDLGFEGEDYLRLTDLQAAAVGWLAQHALFARLAAKHPSRIRILDSETLMERPADAVAACAQLFDLPIDPNAVATGPAFAQHSKHGGAFSAAARAAEYDNASAAHGDELMKVGVWAEAVAAGAGLDLTMAKARLC